MGEPVRPPDARPGSRLLPGLFLATAIASGLHFYLIRNVLDFNDENDHTTIAWLLTKGETLYGSLFSHHMPLPYALGHAVAAVSPTDLPSHFRVVPWLAYLSVALALVGSPLARADRRAGWMAGSGFLAVASLALPPFWGHLLLQDNLAGCGLAVFVASALLPSLIDLPRTRRDDLAAGFAAGLACMASPMVLWPLLAGGLILAASARSNRKGLRAFVPSGLRILTSAAVAAGPVALWLLRFGSLAGFVRDVFVFNREAYAPFATPAGRGTLGVLFSRGFEEWFRALADPDRGTFSSGPRLAVVAFLWFAAGAVVAVGRLASRQSGRVVAAAGGIAVVMFLSRLRGFDFHALPFFILSVAVASLAGSFLLVATPWRRYRAAAAAFAGPLLLLSVHNGINKAWGTGRSSFPPELLPIAEYVRANTDPGERIGAFPLAPRLYLEARRCPATSSIYFLPWQERWETLHPAEPTACEEFGRAKPRFVYLRPETIWGHFAWRDFGRCLDEAIQAGYDRVSDPRFAGLLWVRREEEAHAPPGVR